MQLFETRCKYESDECLKIWKRNLFGDIKDISNFHYA